MIRYIDTKKEWKGEAINGVRHPLSIGKLWEDEDLNAIGLERHFPTPPKPVEVDPLSLPLDAVQFHALLHMSGRRDDIMTVIELLPEPNKSVAKAKIEKSATYDRSDALFDTLGAMLTPPMTPAEIDALWLQALEVK